MGSGRALARSWCARQMLEDSLAKTPAVSGRGMPPERYCGRMDSGDTTSVGRRRDAAAALQGEPGGRPLPTGGRPAPLPPRGRRGRLHRLQLHGRRRQLDRGRHRGAQRSGRAQLAFQPDGHGAPAGAAGCSCSDCRKHHEEPQTIWNNYLLQVNHLNISLIIFYT